MLTKSNFEFKGLGDKIYIDNNEYIGLNCKIANNDRMYDKVHLGDKCIVRSNLVIGESNFNDLLNLDEPKKNNYWR